jgi:hypothetical protein
MMTSLGTSMLGDSQDEEEEDGVWDDFAKETPYRKLQVVRSCAMDDMVVDDRRGQSVRE